MNDIKDIKKIIEKNREYLISKKAEQQVIKKEIKEKTKEMNDLEEKNIKLLTMKDLIQKAGAEARENGRVLLSEIATSAVQTVFGTETKVILEPGMKDGVPNIKVMVRTELESGKVIDIDPTDTDGGGLADMISLSIFMALGQIYEDNCAPYSFDEPTKYINGADFTDKVSQFIRNMVDFTKRQTILSTNDDVLASEADTRYRMIKNKKDGITTAYKEV